MSQIQPIFFFKKIYLLSICKLGNQNKYFWMVRYSKALKLVFLVLEFNMTNKEKSTLIKIHGIVPNFSNIVETAS